MCAVVPTRGCISLLDKIGGHLANHGRVVIGVGLSVMFNGEESCVGKRSGGYGAPCRTLQETLRLLDQSGIQ